MNIETMNKVVRLDEKELQKLTQEVKETLAAKKEFKANQNDRFTAIDMWNCQRQVRSASMLMRRWSN